MYCKLSLLYGFCPLGTVLLDLEKFDLPSIAQAVVENMVLTDQLDQEDSKKVLTALLLQHRHQHQQPGIRRRLSSKKKRKIGVGTDNVGYNAEGEGIGNGSIRLKMDGSKGSAPGKVRLYVIISFVYVFLSGYFENYILLMMNKQVSNWISVDVQENIKFINIVKQHKTATATQWSHLVKASDWFTSWTEPKTRV